MSFLKVIWGVLFDEGSTRSKETKLEALTEVKDRFVIMRGGMDGGGRSHEEQGVALVLAVYNIEFDLLIT